MGWVAVAGTSTQAHARHGRRPVEQAAAASLRARAGREGTAAGRTETRVEAWRTPGRSPEGGGGGIVFSLGSRLPRTGRRPQRACRAQRRLRAAPPSPLPHRALCVSPTRFVRWGGTRRVRWGRGEGQRLRGGTGLQEVYSGRAASRARSPAEALVEAAAPQPSPLPRWVLLASLPASCDGGREQHPAGEGRG